MLTRFKEIIVKETPRLAALTENSHLRLEGSSLIIHLKGSESHLMDLIQEKMDLLVQTIKKLSENKIMKIEVEQDKEAKEEIKPEEIKKIEGFAKEINLDLIDIKDLKGGKNA